MVGQNLDTSLGTSYTNHWVNETYVSELAKQVPHMQVSSGKHCVFENKQIIFKLALERFHIKTISTQYPPVK
jgi:hypothetical protein